MHNFPLKMDQSSISEFPFAPLFAFKFSLSNCSFFHPSPKSIDQIRAILKEDGDFLVQDSKGPKLVLCIRIDSKILEFPIYIVQKGGTLLQFEFAQNLFASLEHLAIFFSKRRNFICTEAGERIHLCRPIYRQKYAGRLGHGECLGLRDSIRPTKIHPSFVRSLRPEFANSKEIIDDLEKLVSLDHRNLVRLRDFFLLPSISHSTLIFLRFDQIQGAHSLFEHLFDQKGPLNLRQYIKWAYQAAKGLNFLIERGILHRRLNARSSLLDSLQNLRLSDFWTENDPGDFGLFQGKNTHLAHHSVHPEAILYKDGWRYLPPETLLNGGQFDSISQVWSFALLIWQIFTHCQFAGNRIFYSSLAEFLSVTGGRDDSFYLPGHLDEKGAQKGMPEERRRKQIFVCASQRLPHAPDSLAQIIPKALLPDRPQRPFFSQLFRVLESEKRILDLANVLGLLL